MKTLNHSSQSKVKPKLLFVVNDCWFFTSHRLPIGSTALERGLDVHLASLRDDTTKTVISAGIRFHFWNILPRSTSFFSELKSLFSLLRIFLKVKPDVVHLVTIKSVLYGGFLARVLRTKCVVFAISGLGHLFSDPKKRKNVLVALTIVFYKFVLKHPNSKVIVQNSSDLEFFITNNLVPQDRIVLLRGSGVDVDKYIAKTANPLAKSKIDRLPTVVLASRMLWDKGIQTFVDAAIIVNKGKPRARFLLVGGSDTENSRSVPIDQLNHWNKEGVVDWQGHSNDVPSVLNGTDIFVLPTTYGEGVPKVLIEASAIGLPIIASDWPGCREIIDSEVNGLLVKPQSAEELSEAIIRLIDNPEYAQALGQAAQIKAVQELDIKFVIDTTCQIYDELLATKQPFLCRREKSE